MAWVVYVHNDNVNSYDGVIYALYRTVGLQVGDALHTTTFVHEHGAAEVGRFADQAEAELLTARLQVFGLHASVAAA